MSDSEYDKICSELLRRYDEIPDKYKSIIDIDNLKCSTAYTLTEDDYPVHIKNSAKFILQNKTEVGYIIPLK